MRFSSHFLSILTRKRSERKKMPLATAVKPLVSAA